MEKEVKILYELFKVRSQVLIDKKIAAYKEFQKKARKNNQSGWGLHEYSYIKNLSEDEQYLYNNVLKPIKSMMDNMNESECKEFHITQRMYKNKSKLEYFETFDDPDENKQ